MIIILSIQHNISVFSFPAKFSKLLVLRLLKSADAFLCLDTTLNTPKMFAGPSRLSPSHGYSFYPGESVLLWIP